MRKNLRLVMTSFNLVLLLMLLLLSVPKRDQSSNNCVISNAVAVIVSYPVLNFSTYLGGSESGEHGRGIAIASDRSYYVMGHTDSSDFPTQNAYDNTSNGSRDVFIAKFAANNSLLWSTYFGGSLQDSCMDMAISTDGNCYITGTTLSDNFPTQNAYNDTYSGDNRGDVFLVKFASNGSLLWSTYFGGNNWDFSYGITIASDGSCYITGHTGSTNFPVQGAYDNTYNGWYFDAFAAKFSTNGSLLWSTYLGGFANDGGYDIAVTSDGSCFVTGFTRSSDFPTTKDAYDASQNGDWDVFVTKLSTNGELLWSTFLGGAWWDEALGIAVATDGSCYLTGYTVSIDFPTLNAYNDTYGIWGDAFVTKFSSNGSLLWSTFLGGNGQDRGYDIAVAVDGSCCYMTGETSSSNFPTQYAYDSSWDGVFDAFISKFSSEGDFLWSSYLGGSQTDEGYGIAVTDNSSCYIVGTTHSPDFPTKNAFDRSLGDACDAFITRFNDTLIDIIPTTTPNFVIRLVFLAALPSSAFILVIAFIVSKKGK